MMKTPEVNKMEVSTARTRLFKVGALVQATHRHIWLRVASHWPGVTGPASHWPGESLARRDAADSRGEGCGIIRDDDSGTLAKSKLVRRSR
jgi:hypothetical protein